MGTTRQKSSCRNRLQNGPRSLSRMKAGTHSPLPTGSHTAAYTPKQGLFRMGALSLPSDRFARSGNPAWPGVRTAYFAAFGPWSRGISKNAESLRNSDALMRVAVPRRRGPAGLRDLFSFLSKLRLVHTRLSEKNRTQGHTRRNRWRFGWGRYHYPRHELHVHEHPRAGCQNGKLCRFWVLVGRCSQRTQRARGTAMRLCASLFQGVAAPLGCVIFFRFCRNYGFHTLCSGLSACARHRRHHYPRRALRASETLDSRLSKRLSCYSFHPS